MFFWHSHIIIEFFVIKLSSSDPKELEIINLQMEATGVQRTTPLSNDQELVTYEVKAISKHSSTEDKCAYERPGGCYELCSLTALRKSTVYEIKYSQNRLQKALKRNHDSYKR